MELTDGRIIAVISQPTPDGSGWVVTHEDITERRRTEHGARPQPGLRQHRDRKRAGRPSSSRTRRTCAIVLINRAGEQYFGVPREIDDRQDSPTEVFPKDIADRIAEHDRELLRNRQAAILRRAPGHHPERRTPHRHHHAHADPRRATASLQYLLTVMDDRTHRKRAEAQIARLVHHDLLTGLPNRAAFTACIDATIETAATDGAVVRADVPRLRPLQGGQRRLRPRRRRRAAARAVASACRPRSAAHSWRGSAATNSS